MTAVGPGRLLVISRATFIAAVTSDAQSSQVAAAVAAERLGPPSR